MKTVFLDHVRSKLALHELRGGDGQPLLILHGLGEQSPSAVPISLEQWVGPVFALDFTGHGQSSVPLAGGYTCEALMSDADAVLAELGPLTLVGYGLGGYVGLLLFGSRPKEILSCCTSKLRIWTEVHLTPGLSPNLRPMSALATMPPITSARSKRWRVSTLPSLLGRWVDPHGFRKS